MLYYHNCIFLKNLFWNQSHLNRLGLSAWPLIRLSFTHFMSTSGAVLLGGGKCLARSSTKTRSTESIFSDNRRSLSVARRMVVAPSAASRLRAASMAYTISDMSALKLLKTREGRGRETYGCRSRGSDNMQKPLVREHLEQALSSGDR